jgi:fumarylacetoacetate (FAA) hydrolase family protein
VDVPEPELAVVVSADRLPLAVTIGNDVPSRDIEGADPLDLPRRRSTTAPARSAPLFVPLDWSAPYEIELRIVGPAGDPVFEGRTTTASVCRSLAELIECLFRDNPVPAGTVLLTRHRDSPTRRRDADRWSVGRDHDPGDRHVAQSGGRPTARGQVLTSERSPGQPAST